MAIPLSYNIRNVLQRPVATLTTAVGVGLTVTIFIGALALAAGFQEALRQSGSAANVIALRKGADSEISSYISRDAANIVRAHPEVATGPDGRPLASPEMVVVTNKPRLGQPGSSNVTVRAINPEGLAVRSAVKIVEGRMFTPGTDEVIVGKRIAPRFAGCGIGAKNTMYAAVGQRTREIATLLVLGFSPAAVMVSFMIESVFLALIGGAIGCLLALPINGIVTSTTNFQSFSEVAFAFRVTPPALGAGLIFAVLMGFVGGLLPAWRASRQSLVESLRQR